ncbi:Os09g0251900 [Oryza sativa Japonica Group]|nr:Os09g0251900 [Oryza sativa Japonica Group]
MPHIHHIQHSRDGVGVGSGAELEYVGSGAKLEYVRGSHEVVISESTNGIGGGVELESMPTVVMKNSSWLDSGSVPTAATKKPSVYRRCGVIETPMGMPSSWLLDGEVRIYEDNAGGGDKSVDSVAYA